MQLREGLTGMSTLGENPLVWASGWRYQAAACALGRSAEIYANGTKIPALDPSPSAIGVSRRTLERAGIVRSGLGIGRDCRTGGRDLCRHTRKARFAHLEAAAQARVRSAGYSG